MVMARRGVKMKRIVVFVIALLMSVSAAYAGQFELSGYLKNETSWGISTDKLSKFKDIIQLSGQYTVNDNWAMFVSGRYWYDNAYGWYHQYDQAQRYMKHIQSEEVLRDCYLDYTSDQFDARLGKQQVVWGTADGIAILDRVNPFDLTEYWLPDAADIRIPLWMANFKYSPKLNSTLQLLVIPDFQQSTAAPPGSPFAFRSYRLFDDFKTYWEGPPIPGVKAYGKLNTNIYYPETTPKIGVQWQDTIHDWEYTLNYLWGYDYLARTYLDSTQVIPPAGFPPIPTVVLNYARRFKIDQMVGGSINHTFTNEGPLQGVTLRSDAAVYLNEPTYYGDPTTGSSAGVNRWDNKFWLIGLDKAIFTKWLVSFQFAQYIMEHKSSGVLNPATGTYYQTLNSYTNGAQDHVDNIFSLKIGSHFMHDRLLPEVLWSFTDDNQGKVSPKVTYEIRDNLWLTMGLHLFYGSDWDSNGQFSQEKQIYTSLKYTF